MAFDWYFTTFLNYWSLSWCISILIWTIAWSYLCLIINLASKLLWSCSKWYLNCSFMINNYPNKGWFLISVKIHRKILIIIEFTPRPLEKVQDEISSKNSQMIWPSIKKSTFIPYAKSFTKSCFLSNFLLFFKFNGFLYFLFPIRIMEMSVTLGLIAFFLDPVFPVHCNSRFFLEFKIWTQSCLIFSLLKKCDFWFPSKSKCCLILKTRRFY